MEQVSHAIALVAALSIAVERVLEMLKGLIPPLSHDWKEREPQRRVVLELLSIIVGSIIAAQMQSDLAKTLPSIAIGWPIFVFLGLLASGGSGLWNHVLDMVRAAKVDKELSTAAKVADVDVKAKAMAAAAARI